MAGEVDLGPYLSTAESITGGSLLTARGRSTNSFGGSIEDPARPLNAAPTPGAGAQRVAARRTHSAGDQTGLDGSRSCRRGHHGVALRPGLGQGRVVAVARRPL